MLFLNQQAVQKISYVGYHFTTALSCVILTFQYLFLCRVNDAQPHGGYVNLLQNPASFPFPQQIPSHPDMLNHTPLPPTQPSATKKMKKRASNKHTHSRTINLENGDDEELANKKRMTWTTKEDERLVSS
jgi:hypothetical protein